MSRVNAESVAEVAEAISLRGEKPTVESIRMELGGSPNTICRLLRAWKEAKAGHPAAEPEAPQPETETEVQDIASVDALPEIAHALDQLTATILKTMTTHVERERTKAASTVQAVQAACDQKVGIVRQAADQQIADVQAQARDALAEADENYDSLSECLEGTEATRDALIAEIAQIKIDIDRLKGDLDQARRDGDALTAQMVAEKAKAAELAIQLDGAIEAKAVAVATTDRLAGEMQDVRSAHLAEIGRLDGALTDCRNAHAAELGRMTGLMEAMRHGHDGEISRLTAAADGAAQVLAEERATHKEEVARLTDQLRDAGARATRAEQRAEALDARLNAMMAAPSVEGAVTANRPAPVASPPARRRNVKAPVPEVTAADAADQVVC